MYFLIIIAVAAIDQILKAVVRAGLDLNESIPVFGNFLSVSLHFNTGAAFSMMQGYRVLLTLFPAVMIGIIIIYIIKKQKSENRLLLVALSIIAGGGLGNLIDRLIWGKVTDFISVGDFPVFNFADMSVVSGCALVVLYLIFFDRDRKTKAVDDKADKGL